MSHDPPVLRPSLLSALAQPGRRACRRPAPKPSVGDVVKKSRPSDWRPLDPDNTLYMELPGRPRGDRTGAGVRAEPRRQHQDAGRANSISTAWPCCARRTTSWRSGAIRTRTTRPPLKFGQAKTLPGEFTVPMSNDKHFTRLPTSTATRRRSATRTASRSGATRRPDQDLADALLRHGRRGPRQRRRQRQRHRAVRRHRPRAAPAGPQHHRGRPRGGGHAAAVVAAARPGADGLLRQAGHCRCRSRRCGGGRRAGSRAQPPGGDAHRSATYKAVVDAQRNRGGPWNKYAANYVDLCNAPIPVREHPKD
jgi:hypothetical protein